MRLFSMLKNAANAVWSTIKAVAAPSFITIGGTISAIGGALFILPKFVKILTGKDDHPASLYASFGVITFSVIINAATRFPAVFRHFNHSSENQPQDRQQDKPVEDKKPDCNRELFLWLLGKGLEYTARGNGYLSLVFMLLGSYLNAVTFVEFLSNRVNADPHAEDAEYLTQLTALTLAICAASKYAIFTLKKASSNAKKLSANIENGTFVWDKEAVITILVSSFGTVAVPFLSYYSTVNALGKIPLLKLSDMMKHALSIVSAITGTTTHLVTQIPAVYMTLTKREAPAENYQKPCWETPSKVMIYGVAGVGDFAATNISVFTSMENTSHDVWGISITNPGLISASITAALSTATLNYFFSVYRGFEDTLYHYHQAHPAVTDEPDLEAGKTVPDKKGDEEKRPLMESVKRDYTGQMFSQSSPVAAGKPAAPAADNKDDEDEEAIGLSISPLLP